MLPPTLQPSGLLVDDVVLPPTTTSTTPVVVQPPPRMVSPDDEESSQRDDYAETEEQMMSPRSELKRVVERVVKSSPLKESLTIVAQTLKNRRMVKATDSNKQAIVEFVVDLAKNDLVLLEKLLSPLIEINPGTTANAVKASNDCMYFFEEDGSEENDEVGDEEDGSEENEEVGNEEEYEEDEVEETATVTRSRTSSQVSPAVYSSLAAVQAAEEERRKRDREVEEFQRNVRTARENIVDEE